MPLTVIYRCMGMFGDAKPAGVALGKGITWGEEKLAQVYPKHCLGTFLEWSVTQSQGENKPVVSVGKPRVQCWSSVLVLLSLAPQKYQEITLFNLCLLPALNICRQRGPAYKFHWAKCSTSVLNLSCTACTWMDKKRAVLPTELPVLPFQLTADLQQQEQGWKRTR